MRPVEALDRSMIRQAAVLPRPRETLLTFGPSSVPKSQQHRYDWYIQVTGDSGFSWNTINCSNMDSNGIVTTTVDKTKESQLYRVCGVPKR